MLYHIILGNRVLYNHSNCKGHNSCAARRISKGKRENSNKMRIHESPNFIILLFMVLG